MRAKRIPLDEARARYPQIECMDWLFPFTGGAVTLYEGDLTTDVASILDLHPEGTVRQHGEFDEGSLLVVDGDLVFTGHVTWGDRGDYSNDGLLCTKTLRAKSLELGYTGSVLLDGDLEVDYLYVHEGGDGGSLLVGGDLLCKVAIATTYFVVEVRGAVRAETIIVDDTYARDFAAGLDTLSCQDDAERFVEAVGGSKERIFGLLCAGEEVFVPADEQ